MLSIYVINGAINNQIKSMSTSMFDQISQLIQT